MSRCKYVRTVAMAESSATKALADNESGCTFTNEGASALVAFTLPAAVAGLQYTFICQDADFLSVNAQAGDTIRIAGSVSTGGGSKTATAIGDTLSIMAINATEWIATSVNGTWTNA